MEIFRKKGFKIFFAFFAAFFMGVFGFGVVNFFGGGRGLVTVGKKEILPQDYLKAYENIAARSRQLRQNQTPQQQNYQKVQALYGLINNHIITMVAEEMGLAVSDEELIQVIKDTGQFSKDNGEFDSEKYQEFLATQGLSANEFEKNFRKDILQQKWAKLVLPVAMVSNQTDSYFQSQFSRTANIRYFEVPSFIIKPKIKVSDEQLQTFYGESTQAFRTAKSYKINLMEVSKEIFKDKINSQEIQNYYNNNRGEFSQKGSFLASHILFSIDSGLGLEQLKKKTEEVYRQAIKNKKLFVSLAKKYSDDPGSKTKGGNLGWTNYGSFVKEFEEQVKTMKKGEIAKPFLSQFGYHIVYLKDKKEAKEFSFQEVQAAIKEILLKNKLNNFLNLVVQRYQAEQGFQKISQDYNLPYNKDLLVTENTKYKDIPLAFIYNSLKEKSVNTLDTYATEEKYLFYKLNESVAGEKIAFEKIKKDVLAAYLREAHSKIADAKQKEFSQKYQTRQTFESLKNLWNISKVVDKNLIYTDSLEEDPLVLNFKNIVFQLKPGQMVVRKHSDKLFIILLDRFTENPNNNSATHFTKESLENIKTSLLVDKLIDFRSQQIDISYNENLLKQYNIPIK